MGSYFVAAEPVVLVLHFIVSFFLIAVILLQSGKGDIGAAFGAGGSQSLFGARGAATLLTKLTTTAAVLFLMTSLSLATAAKHMATGVISGSVIENELQKQKPTPQPAPTTEKDSNAMEPSQENVETEDGNNVSNN
jgi:preprotein translocase subunit SecG